MDKMDARSLEEAAAQIERQGRRVREHAGLAVAAVLAALLALPFSRFDAALALGVGGLVQVLLGARARLSRCALIERLAVEPAAYVIGEVRSFGLRLAEPPNLAELARRLRSVIADASVPGTVWLPDRVHAFTAELDALARDLLSPSVAVEPTSAVLCHRLLVDAVNSPLCNPQLAPADLALALHRIRGGIRTD
jgi:hypothetical protein